MPAACRAIVDEPLARHRAQRVRRVADGHERVARDLPRRGARPAPGRPRRCGRRSAAGPGLGPRPAPAARVRGHQQHDAHADRARRVDDGQRELVGLLVRRPVGAVVDVVELADRRVAGAPARVEALLGDGAHAARVERLGGRVHRLAPRPEVVLGRRGGAHLDAAAQMALEGVRVAVDEARHEQPAAAGARRRPAPPRRPRPPTRGDLARPSSSTATPARTVAARLEHEIGDEQRAAHGSIGRSRPRSRAVSRASS